MRFVVTVFSLLFGAAIPAATATAGASVAVSAVSIGIHLSAYPELVPIPGYPVYYAPRLRANYFFHDGFYWVYHGDHWYVSAWYNGPWDLVDPYDVPLVVLQVPVRYYPAPPVYFHAWIVDAPPRWDLHWGHRWARHRHDWDHRDRRVVHAPAPLPRQHVHPRSQQQHAIRRGHDREPSRGAYVQRGDQRQYRSRGFAQPSRSVVTPVPQAVTPLPLGATAAPQLQRPFRGHPGRPAREAPRMQVRERVQVDGSVRQFRGNPARRGESRGYGRGRQ